MALLDLTDASTPEWTTPPPLDAVFHLNGCALTYRINSPGGPENGSYTFDSMGFAGSVSLAGTTCKVNVTGTRDPSCTVSSSVVPSGGVVCGPPGGAITDGCVPDVGAALE
jgi:hypothetical protein